MNCQSTSNKYYVYLDLTNDGKVFYVGQGSAARIKRQDKNKKHGRIAKKYGFTRKVVYETTDQNLSHRRESFLIGKHGTFYEWSELGCNMTFGGWGLKGFKHTKETLLKMRKNAANHWKGKSFSEERKELVSGEKSGRFIGYYHCGEHGCFPSRGLASKEIGISESSIRSKINNNKDKDWFFEPKEK